MKEATIYVLGYNDMFSPYGLENLTVLEIDGKTLAIEAPCHITKSMAKIPHSDSEIMGRKINGLIVTHPDDDHKSGIGTLLWIKRFAEKEKLLLIALPETANAIWEGFSGTARISREDGKTAMNFSDCTDLIGLQFGKTRNIPQLGIQIEAFHRSTKHAEYLFGSLAFKVLINGIPILAYSGDTAFDPELYEFLAKGGNYPIIHEAGSYSLNSPSHTDIRELLTLPRQMQERIYLNHIPRTLENMIKEEIKKADSPIRIAYELDKMEVKP